MSIVSAASTRVVRAAGLTLAGQVGALLLTFIATVLMVRSLGPTDYGSYTTLVAVLGLVMLLPDFGLSPILIRDLAAHPASSGTIVGSALFVRGLLLTSGIGVFHVAGPLAGFTADHMMMMDVLFLGGLFSGRVLGMRNILDAVYRSRLTLGIPTSAMVLDGVMLVAGVIAVSYLHPTLWAFVLVSALSPLPGFLVTAGGLIPELRGRLRVDRLIVRALMKDALPIAAYVGLTTLFSNFDVLLLGQWRSLEEVGYYAAALRLTAPLQFLPLAIAMGLFPLQAQMAETSSSEKRPPFTMGFKIVTGLGFAFAMGGLLSGSGILEAVYGAPFSKAGTSLSLLLGGTMFGFGNLYLVSYNNATRRQKTNSIIFAGALVVNIGLNLALVPTWSHEGSALARFVAEGLTFSGLVWTVRSHVTLPPAWLTVRLASSGIVALFVGWTTQMMHPLAQSGIVVLAVLAGLVVFRFFDWDEVVKVGEAIPASLRRQS